MRTRAVLLTLAAACAVYAQTAGFEIVSVKPAAEGARGASEFGCTNGRFIASGLPVSESIAWAYSLNTYQRPKLPDWAEQRGANYDIEAKAAAPLTQEQCKRMVEALLTDRFKLVVHWETKQISLYELVVAKNGPKVQTMTAADQGRGVQLSISGHGIRNPKGYSMQQLAEALSALAVHAPVIDKTGLEGVYKITLAFASSAPAVQQASDDPDVFTAVQEQLGLKLQPGKDPVQVLIADHMERPDGN